MLDKLRSLKTGQELKVMFEENNDYFLIRKEDQQYFLVAGKYTGSQGRKNLNEVINLIR